VISLTKKANSQGVNFKFLDINDIGIYSGRPEQQTLRKKPGYQQIIAGKKSKIYLKKIC